MKAVSAQDELVLRELVAEWQQRQAAGEALSCEDLCRDHPDLLPELRRQLAALEPGSGSTAAWEATPVPLSEQATQQPVAALDQLSTVAPGYTHPHQASADRAAWPLLPGYEILGELGRGGMGVVYKARQLCLKRLVALKVILNAEHAREEDRRRFQVEAEAVARLQHSNIVQVFEVGEHNGLPFFSLEYCHGGSLASRLGGKPVPVSQAAEVVETLARAVQAAHDKGIIHRDLKPANVLYTEDGTLKLTDFGLARCLGEAGATRTGSILGTPSYMAPEQANGEKEIGPAADVYALGAILYACLTGSAPFKGTTLVETVLRVTTDPPVPPAQVQPGIPAALEAICLKCLQKKPGERFASAAELADALRRFREGKTIPLAPGPDQVALALAGKKRWPRWWLGGAAAMLLAAGVVLAVILSRRTGPPLDAPSSATPELGAVPEPSKQPPVKPPAAPEKVKVLRLDVKLFPTVMGHRAPPKLIGKEAFAARLNDSLTVHSQLSRPAYAFLIAFRPDGVEEVCFPEKDDEPPSLSDIPRYPSVSKGYNYGLEDGTGLQAFALVVSSKPLPSYKEWRSRCSPSPWGKHPAITGVVLRADGVDDVEVLACDPANDQRGKRVEAVGRTPMARLADWLLRQPQVEVVEVLGMAVDPREKR